MLEDQARHVRVVAWQHEAHRVAGDRLHRPEQVLEHVGVVVADLQHDAAGHALGGIAPRIEVDLAQAVAADVRLRVDQLAEFADVLLDPAEVRLAPPLVAERQHHFRFSARRGQGLCIFDRVRDRLIEEDVLAGVCRSDRRFEMDRVRRGVDDRLDAAVIEDLFVGPRRAAAVFGRKFLALVLGAAVARRDRELAGALDGIGKHIRPPAHADARDLHLMASAASLATRSSNAQSPPATPTAPMHSLPAMIGQPPSIAVQRSGPAARERPSACATSSAWPCAPFEPVARLFEAAHTALVVAECTVWKRPPSMRSSRMMWPPASTIATETATLASCAFAVAVAMIFLAPAAVRRFASAMYIGIY